MIAKKSLLAVGAAGSPFVLFYKIGMFSDAHYMLWLCMAFWIAACAADIAYTLRHSGHIAGCEQNPVLRSLTGRLWRDSDKKRGLWAAAIFALTAEAVLVAVAAPFLVVHRWDFGFVAGVAAVLAGAAHVAGTAESMSFVRGYGRNMPRGGT